MTKSFTTIFILTMFSILLSSTSFFEFSILLALGLLTVCFEKDLRAGAVFLVVLVSPGLYPSVKICLGYAAAQEKLVGPGHKFWTPSPDIGIESSSEIDMQ